MNRFLRRFFMTPKLIRLIVVAAVLCLAIPANDGTQIRRAGVASQTARARLADLVSTRLSEARFSFLAYSSHDLHDSAQPSAARGFTGLARNIQEQASKAPSAQTWADLAALKLVARRFDEAAKLLERSVAAEPRDPQVQSDLSATYFARWEKTHNPEELVRALGAADRAVSLDPKLPEAQFNLALACEGLSLRHDAMQAWQRQILLEPSSGWSREALERRRAMQAASGPVGSERELALAVAITNGDQSAVRRIASAVPSLARRYGEENLLRRWTLAVRLGRREEAARTLSSIREIGSVVAEIQHDQMLAEVAAEIDGLWPRPLRRRQLQALQEGLRRFSEGLDSYGQRDGIAMVRSFSLSRAWLERAHSPLAAWASSYLAAGYYFFPDSRRALSVIEPLAAAIRGGGKYPSLQARLYWQSGLIRSVLGDLAGSQRDYLIALETFERIGDAEGAAVIHVLISENLRSLGEPRAAWQARYAALSLLGRVENPRWRHNILFDAAQACGQSGEYGAALHFQDDLVRTALELGDPPATTEALLSRSETLAKLRQRSQMQQDLLGAWSWTSRISSPGVRKRLQADVALRSGELAATTDSTTAIRSLSSALAFYDAAHFTPYSIEAHLARARSHRQIGELGAAAGDLRQAMSEADREREALPLGQMRVSFLDSLREVYDEMISLQTQELHNSAEAFSYVEAARARTLAEEVAAQAGVATADLRRPPPGAREISRSLPSGTAVVEYAALPDVLLIWVIRSHAVDATSVPLRYTALQQDIEQAIVSMSSAFSVSDQLSGLERLHRVLIAPVLPFLEGATTLVIVPDKVIGLVPFAAMYDPGSRQFLLEQRIVTMCPSSALYLRLSAAGRARQNEGVPTALIIANPLHDERLFPHLAKLRHAQAEGEAITNIYPSARLLSGKSADKAAFLRNATSYGVVHYSGHSLLNRNEPELSMLVLAGGGGKGQTDGLYSHELAQLHFKKTRLVVLAGCNTAAGRVGDGEGVLSLARIFIAAGVPAVVGSLWNVEDQQAGELLVAMHRRFAAGDGPASALRAAQLATLAAHRDDPSALSQWSSFMVISDS